MISNPDPSRKLKISEDVGKRGEIGRVQSNVPGIKSKRVVRGAAKAQVTAWLAKSRHDPFRTNHVSTVERAKNCDSGI